MTDQTIRIIARSEGIDKAAKSAKILQQEVGKLSRERGLDRLAKDAATGSVNSRELAKRLDAVGASEKEIAKVTRAMQRYSEATQNAEKQVTRLQSQQERFDQTSRSVALAGDVQSNLGALSGISGAVGGGKVSQGIGIAGEFVVLAEELPRLKDSLSGLPDTFKAAAQAAGLTGLGLGAATIALAAAYTLAAKAAAKQREALDAEIAARRNALDLVSAGSGTEDIQAELDKLRQQRESANRQLDETSAALNAFEQNANLAVRGVANLSAAIGVGDQSIAAYRDTVKDAESEVNSLDTQIRILEQALEDGAVAANDAAIKEQELAEQRQRTLDATVASTQQLIQTLGSENFGTQQLEDLIRSREIERDSILAVIDTAGLSTEAHQQYSQRLEIINSDLQLLNTTGTSVARTNQILIDSEKTLNDVRQQAERTQQQTRQSIIASIRDEANAERQLAQLQRTATTQQTADRLTALRDEQAALEQVIQQLTPLAATNEDYAQELARTQVQLAKVKRDIESTFGEVAPAAIARLRKEIQSQVADAGRTRDTSINKAGDERADTLKQAAATLAKGLADLDRDFTQQQQKAGAERVKALADFQRDERNRVQDHYKELTRISRDAQDETQDAAIKLDAAGVRSAQRQKDRAVDDANERFAAETQAAQERLQEIKREASEERKALIESYQQRRADLIQANQEQVRAANERYRTEVQQANQAYQTQVKALREKLRTETQLVNQAYQSQVKAAQSFAQAMNKVAQQSAAAAAGIAKAKSVAQAVGNTGIGKSLKSTFGNFFGGIFHDGIDSVPREGLSLLAGGERVINSGQNERITRALEGMNGRNTSGVQNMTFAPQITVMGNASTDTVRRIDDRIRMAFNEYRAITQG